LCLTVESALREPQPGRVWSRLGLVAFGASFLAVLLICCRFLAQTIAHHPVLFGPLIIGALVVFSAAFYATFFARATEPGEARALPLRTRLATATMAGESSPQAEP
jgi:hypothetical protein